MDIIFYTLFIVIVSVSLSTLLSIKMLITVINMISEGIAKA